MSGDVREAYLLLGKIEKRLAEDLSDGWEGEHHDTLASCLSMVRTAREGLAGMLEPEMARDLEGVRRLAAVAFDDSRGIPKGWPPEPGYVWTGGDC